MRRLSIFLLLFGYTVVCVSGTYFYCEYHHFIANVHDSNQEKSTSDSQQYPKWPKRVQVKNAFSGNQHTFELQWENNEFNRETGRFDEVTQAKRVIQKQCRLLKKNHIEDFSKPSVALVNYSNAMFVIQKLNVSDYRSLPLMPINGYISLDSNCIAPIYLSPTCFIKEYTFLQYTQEGQPIWVVVPADNDTASVGLGRLDLITIRTIDIKEIKQKFEEKSTGYHYHCVEDESAPLLLDRPVLYSATNMNGVQSPFCLLLDGDGKVK